MTTRPLKLEVITPDRVVLSDRGVVSVTAPGSEGYLGVLANHAPLMTELAIGELDFRRADGTEESMAVAGGVMEVHENKVTVLAEIAELREEIDIDRAEQSLQRAKERIAARTPDIDADRATVALKRALNRLNVARKS